jgi:uncharacterized protein YyaL (SSP411 family)
MDSLRSEPVRPGDIGEPLLGEAVKKVLSEFDPQNGGFGTAPKFPMPGALDFLINRYFLYQEETVGLAVRKTLENMASGGFHDHVGGGFHRYSTDASWIIPHFEKMADDNAWLLKIYLSAYSVFREESFKEVAEGIIDFTTQVLSDPDGGFYASQDADVTPDDEGGYFTWTDEDLKNVLSEEEYRIISLHLMNEAGSMHHDGSKKVLFAVMGAKEVADRTGKDIAEVLETIRRGKEKLLRARNARETPFVDKNLYTSTNGMLISSFLLGYRTLGDRGLRDFAIRSLERIMSINFVDKNLFHSPGVKAMLDDYACLTDALIAAYEATGVYAYLSHAEQKMRVCINKLWDTDSGGFFDSEDHPLGVSIKGVEDMPHPSANALCIRSLIKLFLITGKDIYHQYAEKSLKAFSLNADALGIHAGYYFSAMEAYHNMMTISLYTESSGALAREAVSLPAFLTSIVYKEDRGCVIPCIHNVCYEPVYNEAGLKDFFYGRKYLERH